MKKPVIFLAAPYMHPQAHIRQLRADFVARATAILLAHGHPVLSPVLAWHAVIEDLPHQIRYSEAYWKRVEVESFVRCDFFLAISLQGWERSAFVRQGSRLAHEAGIQSMAVNATLDEIRAFAAAFARWRDGGGFDRGEKFSAVAWNRPRAMQYA